MKKRLVFFIYVDVSYRESKIYDLHFALLKRYSKVFDCATFYLSLNEINEENMNFAIELASKIVGCGFIKDVEIKVKQNTDMREADCFKEEVVGRIMNNIPELVFFSHTKGLSNEFNSSLINWICGMYYFSLEFMSDVKTFLVDYGLPNCGLFYGFPLSRWYVSDMLGTRDSYSGTIFWTNCSKAAEYNKFNNINPIKDYMFSSRSFAEDFPGKYFPNDLLQSIFLPKEINYNLYYDFDSQLNSIYEENGFELKYGFDLFVKDIRNEIGV